MALHLAKHNLLPAILLIIAFFNVTSHADYRISQKHIFYNADQRSVSVKVSNPGKSLREYSVVAQPWDEATKATGAEMIAYPPVFELGPEETQIVRLLLRDKKSLSPPLFFRFVLRESDPVGEAPKQPSPGLNIPIATSFPVYYIDRNVKPKASIQTKPSPEGFRVLVTNTGNTLLEIRGATDARGRDQPLNKRILPGRKELFLFKDWQRPFRFKVAYGDDIVVN